MSQIGDLMLPDLDRYTMEIEMETETSLQQMMARLLAGMKASQAEMKASRAEN
jgi:hypothetical protein